MPIYDFECESCNEEFEHLSFKYIKEDEKVECPKCHELTSKRIINCTAALTFSNPVGTDKWNNSHDYRFHYNLNRPGGPKDQRRKNEERFGKAYENVKSIDKEIDL